MCQRTSGALQPHECPVHSSRRRRILADRLYRACRRRQQQASVPACHSCLALPEERVSAKRICGEPWRGNFRGTRQWPPRCLAGYPGRVLGRLHLAALPLDLGRDCRLQVPFQKRQLPAEQPQALAGGIVCPPTLEHANGHAEVCAKMHAADVCDARPSSAMAHKLCPSTVLHASQTWFALRGRRARGPRTIGYAGDSFLHAPRQFATSELMARPALVEQRGFHRTYSSAVHTHTPGTSKPAEIPPVFGLKRSRIELSRAGVHAGCGGGALQGRGRTRCAAAASGPSTRPPGASRRPRCPAPLAQLLSTSAAAAGAAAGAPTGHSGRPPRLRASAALAGSVVDHQRHDRATIDGEWGR